MTGCVAFSQPEIKPVMIPIPIIQTHWHKLSKMRKTQFPRTQAQITNYPTGPLNPGLYCAPINSTVLQPQGGQHRRSQQQPQFLNTSCGPFHYEEADTAFATPPELNNSGSFQNQANPQTSHPVAMAYQTTYPNSIHNSTHVVPSTIFPTPLPRYSATNQASHPGHETIRPMSLTEATNRPMGRAQPESQHPDQIIPVISNLHVPPTSAYASMQHLNPPKEQDEHPVYQHYPIAEITSGRGFTITSHRSPPLAQGTDTSVSTDFLNNFQNSQRPPQSAAPQDNRPTPIQSSEVSMSPVQSSYQNPHQVSFTIPALNSLGGDQLNGHSNPPTLVDTRSAAPSESHKGSKTPAAHTVFEPQNSSAAHTKTSETLPAPMVRQESASTLAKNSDPWNPRPQHTGGTLPPPKTRRLENGNRQPVVTPKPPCTKPSANGLPQTRTLEGHVKRPHQKKSLKERNDMAQPINTTLALAKVSYDSTTIARDVLVAAGKHPRRARLNQRLEKLQRNFPKITFKADLQTFRWDLVDVKQPESFTPHTAVSNPTPMHHPAPVSVSASRPHPISGLSLGFIQPFRLDSVPPLAFAGRSNPQSYISSRDHTRDAPATRPPPMPTKIDARAPSKGLSSWGTLQFNPPNYNSSLRVPPSDSSSAPPNSEPSPQTPLSSVSVTHHNPQPKHAHLDTPPAIEQNTAKHQPHSDSKNQQTEVQLDSDQVSKPAEAQHLLRPKVVISSSPDKMSGNGRPGRPPKRAASSFEVLVPREKHVEYPVFACQWEGCVAELHNIQSLQTHIVKNHVPHHLICKWEGCDNKIHMAAAAMFSHVSGQHISKMAWKLGDGPLVPKTGENQ